MIASLSPAEVPHDLDQLLYRWIHVVAGVLWIGLLYFFNWVNAGFAPTMDAETKKKVVPELMPRALFWFRWGAAVTWLTGVALAMVIYYMAKYGSYLFAADSPYAGTKPGVSQWIVPFALLVVGFLVYDNLFKLLAKQHAVAVVIWGALAVGYGVLLIDKFDFSNRAAFIHVAALFGTTMAANVWMRIWPAQRRIITATKNGQAPDPKDPATAGLRSRHNTYMSVPLLLMMVSVHQDGLLAAEPWWAWMTGILVVAFLGTYAIYKGVPKVKGF